jgi:large subunit ribosomal protein L21
MYAVISTGGKQYRVSEGERLEVERLGDPDTSVELSPILVVDGDRVVSAAKDLAKAKVEATIVGEAKGPKIVGFTYKNKTNQRKRWGHRQHYSTIEITGITGIPGAAKTKG